MRSLSLASIAIAASISMLTACGGNSVPTSNPFVSSQASVVQQSAVAESQSAASQTTASFTQLYPSYRSGTVSVSSEPLSATADWVTPVAGSNITRLPDGAVGRIMPYQTVRAQPIAGNTYSNMIYHGGPIQKSPKLVLILWGFGKCTSSGCSNDPSGTEGILYNFAKDVGGAHILHSTVQYYSSAQGYITNPTNTLISFLIDNNFAPANPTTAQIQKQVVVAQKFLSMTNNKDVNYIVSLGYHHDPPGFGPGGYCAFHTAFGTSTSPQPFTVDPYVTEAGTGCAAYTVDGPLDGVSVVLGHEIGETITDPGLNAWYDTDGLSGENGDKCANRGLDANVSLRGLAVFPVQPLWSNAAHGCVF